MLNVNIRSNGTRVVVDFDAIADGGDTRVIMHGNTLSIEEIDGDEITRRQGITKDWKPVDEFATRLQEDIVSPAIFETIPWGGYDPVSGIDDYIIFSVSRSVDGSEGADLISVRYANADSGATLTSTTEQNVYSSNYLGVLDIDEITARCDAVRAANSDYTGGIDVRIDTIYGQIVGNITQDTNFIIGTGSSDASGHASIANQPATGEKANWAATAPNGQPIAKVYDREIFVDNPDLVVAQDFFITGMVRLENNVSDSFARIRDANNIPRTTLTPGRFQINYDNPDVDEDLDTVGYNILGLGIMVTRGAYVGWYDNFSIDETNAAAWSQTALEFRDCEFGDFIYVNQPDQDTDIYDTYIGSRYENLIQGILTKNHTSSSIEDLVLFKGDYDSTRTYERGDIVFVAGEGFFISPDNANTGNNPPDGVWVRLSTIYRGAYSNTTEYHVGDLVFSSATPPVFYISRTNANTGNALTDTDNWQEITSSDSTVFKGDYASGTTYSVGDIVDDGSSPSTFYVSRQGSNTGNALTSANHWQEIGGSETISDLLINNSERGKFIPDGTTNVAEALAELDNWRPPTWDSGTTYEQGNAVTGSNGRFYISIQTTSNVNPVNVSSETSWREVAQPRIRYGSTVPDSLTALTGLDQFYIRTGGTPQFYVSLSGANTWSLVDVATAGIPEWTQGVGHSDGEYVRYDNLLFLTTTDDDGLQGNPSVNDNFTPNFAKGLFDRNLELTDLGFSLTYRSDPNSWTNPTTNIEESETFEFDEDTQRFEFLGGSGEIDIPIPTNWSGIALFNSTGSTWNLWDPGIYFQKNEEAIYVVRYSAGSVAVVGTNRHNAINSSGTAISETLVNGDTFRIFGGYRT